MSVPDLSPRDIGAVTDRAVGLYRTNFRTIVIASLVIVFPFALAAGLLQTFYFRGILELAGSLDEFAQSGNAGTTFSVTSMLYYPVTMLFTAARAYFACALYSAAPSMLYGHRMGPKEFIRGGTRRLLPFIVVSVAVYTATQIGLVFLVVPGAIIAVRWSLAALSTAAEQAGIDQAFKRSWSLTKGSGWRILGFIVALWVLTTALESTVNAPAVIRQLWDSAQNPEAIFSAVPVWWKTVEGLLSATAVALVLPFADLCWFSLYLDLRARRDGMDLYSRAQALGSER